MTMLRNVAQGGSIIGKELKGSGYHVFFGNKKATLEQLKILYPDYTFHFMKQVHGDRLEKAPAAAPADAQWTESPNEAVAVYTADCLPVLLFWPKSLRAAAIHAGWRGIAAEIVPKTLSALTAKDEPFAFVGPHIRANSFEVHDDVAATLAKVGPPMVLHTHPEAGKKFVDLTAIAQYQLEKNGVARDRQLVDTDNTFGNDIYYSFRGDRANCGRLISFIALTSNRS